MNNKQNQQAQGLLQPLEFKSSPLTLFRACALGTTFTNQRISINDAANTAIVFLAGLVVSSSEASGEDEHNLTQRIELFLEEQIARFIKIRNESKEKGK